MVSFVGKHRVRLEPNGGAITGDNPKHLQRKKRFSQSGLKFLILIGFVCLVFFIASIVNSLMVVKREIDLIQSTISQPLEGKDSSGSGNFTNVVGKVNNSLRVINGETDTASWHLAEQFPIFGENFHAVRVMGEQSLNLSSTILLPILDGSVSGQEQQNAKGRGIESFGTTIITASQEINRAAVAVNAVNPLGLAPQISSVFDKFKVAVAYMQLASLSLGLEKEATIALMGLNSSEITALGGSSEQITLLSSNMGKVKVLRQISSADDLQTGEVEIPIGAQTRELVGDDLTSHPQAMTQRPDFPTAALAASKRIEQAYGTKPDLVIGMNPLAIANLIAATGDIHLSNGVVLTPTNAAAYLMNGVYIQYANQEINSKTNAIFEEVASKLFHSLFNEPVDPVILSKSLFDSINQRDIYLWAQDSGLEKSFSGEKIAGKFLDKNDKATQIGVFFRDISVSKIDYYLESDVLVSANSCVEPTEFRVTVKLHSTLSEGLAKTLPAYIKPNNGSDWRSFQTRVLLYAPIGFEFTSSEVVEQNATVKRGVSGSDLNRPVSTYQVDLNPGGTAELVVVISGISTPLGPPEIWTTRLLNGKSRLVC